MAGAERLVGLYHDADACFAQVNGTIQAKARACASDFLSGLVLVASSPSPADNGAPTYLLDKGEISQNETLQYYAEIAAPPTLAEFRTRYGFDLAVSDEASASYYNSGDLGIGREMHCASFPSNGLSGVACYVRNFGEFGGSIGFALSELAAGTAFATVAMVYEPPFSQGNSVQFMVYGATGALASLAALDTQADNESIPNNCLNCHGGSGRYETNNERVRGARFLPFDPSAFLFADTAGLRLADQQDDFRRLNQLVLKAEPTIAMREMVEGFYGGAAGLALQNTPANTRYVPPGWTESSATVKVYQEVVGPYCRSCHVSQQTTALARDILDFSSSAVFLAQANQIVEVVCGTPGSAASHTMPNAEVTLKAFWASPARAYLLAYLGATGACSP